MRGEELDRLQGEALDRWYRRTPDDIEREKRQAEADGWDIWASAARGGKQAVARPQSELRALGREARNPALWREGFMQVDAGVRGAADALTLGTADEISAGIDAAMGKGGPGGIKQRYQVNVQRERARDAYDAEHRSVARGVGEFVGNVAGLYEGGAKVGVGVSSRLPVRVKGRLGEMMSEAKTVWKGDRVAGRQKRKAVLGGYTIADHLTRDGMIVEAKFGPAASLTNRQRQAQREYGELYRVDRWLPKHVGYATGAVGAGAAVTGQAVDRLR